ncbi:MAG: cation diffusion facilitator family transporter [Candidatus Woesearchaeota archaeon]
MKEQTKTAVIIGLISNIILFSVKLAAGLLSNSIAVISDAANSFIDIFSSFVISRSVKVASKKADKDHPFGHHGAEPIGALIIAIITGVLGFELFRESIMRLITPIKESAGLIAISALIISITAKTVLYIYFKKVQSSTNSPAIGAAMIDSKNDILASTVALAGVFTSYLGLNRFDAIAGILVSILIFISGYKLALENLDYLMGKSPSDNFLLKLREKAISCKGVIGVNDIRAHFMGNKINVELHAEVDEKINTKRSHDIGKAVQKKLEDMHDINKAFIHVDPMKNRKK